MNMKIKMKMNISKTKNTKNIMLMMIMMIMMMTHALRSRCISGKSKTFKIRFPPKQSQHS